MWKWVNRWDVVKPKGEGMKPTKTNMVNIHDYLNPFIMIQLKILSTFHDFFQVGGSIPLSTYQSDLLLIFPLIYISL